MCAWRLQWWRRSSRTCSFSGCRPSSPTRAFVEFTFMTLAFMSQPLSASLRPREEGSEWSRSSGSMELGLAADELRTPWVFWQSHPSHTSCHSPAHPIPFPLASGPTFFLPRVSLRGSVAEVTGKMSCRAAPALGLEHDGPGESALTGWRKTTSAGVESSWAPPGGELSRPPASPSHSSPCTRTHK